MALTPFRTELNEAREVAGSPTTLVQPDFGAEALRSARKAGESALDFFEGRRLRDIREQTEGVLGEEIENVLTANSPQLSEDLKGVERLEAARKQGRISRDAFFARLDARVSSLKRNNPGFEDEIDARVRTVLGQDPRQARLAIALREQQEKDAFDDLVIQTMIRENAAAFNDDGTVDIEGTRRKAAAFFRNRQKIDELQQQLKFQGNRGGSGSSTKISAEELPAVEDTEELLGEQYTLFVGDNLLQLASQADKLGPQQLQELETQARTAMFNLQQTLNNQIVQGNYSPAARKRLQEFTGSLIEPLQEMLTNKDYGALGASGRYLKALENRAKINFAEGNQRLFSLMTVFGDRFGAEIGSDLILRGAPETLGELRGEFLNYLEMSKKVTQAANGQGNPEALPDNERRQVAAEKHRQAIKTLENFDIPDDKLEKWGRLATMDTLSFDEVKNDFSQLTGFLDDYFRPNNFDKVEKLSKQAPEVGRGVTDTLVSALNSQVQVATSSLLGVSLEGAPQAGPTIRGISGSVRLPRESFRGELELDPNDGKFRLRLGDRKNSVVVEPRDFGTFRQARVNEVVPGFGIGFGEQTQVPVVVDKLIEAGVDPQAVRQLVRQFNARDTFLLLSQMNQATERMARLTELPTVQDKRSLFEIRRDFGKLLGIEGVGGPRSNQRQEQEPEITEEENDEPVEFTTETTRGNAPTRTAPGETIPEIPVGTSTSIGATQ